MLFNHIESDCRVFCVELLQDCFILFIRKGNIYWALDIGSIPAKFFLLVGT